MGEVTFAHAFWGEKNIGFETLMQNLKSGLKNTNDFYDFLRELNSLEDSYGKLYAKLSKQISNYATVGSFKPCWNIILETLDQMVIVKGSMCAERLNLMKDVQKYSEELQKKHRQLRENEAGTQEVVHAFQAATTQLQKAKDLYHTRYTEYERIRLNEAHSAKEKEKAEGKLKKAQDDYKYSVEKYNNLRTQFVEKMRASCAHFQDAEYVHLERMYDFLARYSLSSDSGHHSLARLCSEFDSKRAKLTPSDLSTMLVAERGTGTQEPLVAAFEDVEVAAAFNGLSSSANVGGSSDKDSPLPSLSCDAADDRQQNCHRAASAFASVGGSVGDVTFDDRPNNASAVAAGTEKSWASSLNEVRSGGGGSGSSSATVSRRRWEAAMTGGGSLFSRRNRQHSFSVENGSENSSTLVAGPTTAASTNGGGGGSGSGVGGGGGGLMLRWANVRNRSRIPRKLSTSPATVNDPKTEATGNANTPVTDEEGFSVPPEDRWGSQDMHQSAASSSPSSSESSDSDTDKTVGHSFKGIKVKIRPLGDLAPGVMLKTDASITPLDLPANTNLRRALRPYASLSSPRSSADRPTLRDFRSSTRTAAAEGTLVAAPAVAVTAAPSADSETSIARSRSLNTPSSLEFPLAPLIPPPPPPPPTMPPASAPSTFSYSNTWAISRPRPHTSLAQAIPLLTQPPARNRSSNDIAFPTSEPNAVQITDSTSDIHSSIAQSAVSPTTSTHAPAPKPDPTSTSASPLSNKTDPAVEKLVNRQDTNPSTASSITTSQITLKEEPNPTSSPSLKEEPNLTSSPSTVVTTEVGGTVVVPVTNGEPGWRAVFPSESEVYEVPRYSKEENEYEVARPEPSLDSYGSIVEESTLTAEERPAAPQPRQQRQAPPLPPPSLSAAPPPPPPKSFHVLPAVPPAAPPPQPSPAPVERTLAASVALLDPFAPNPAPVILPIAVAVTETWRAQFPNGGGSSFSIAAGLAARHSITGQLILAVARSDLLQVHDLCQKWAGQVPTLVLLFNNCQRMRALQPAFPGVSISSSQAVATGTATTTGDEVFPTSYSVSVAGDVLLQGLNAAATSSHPAVDSEYTRLGLLNYSVDLKGLRPPITMCTFWRCEPASTDFRLDYCIQWPRDHSNVDHLGARCQDLRVTLLVDGGVTHMESHPAGNLDREKSRASWNVPIDGTAAPASTATSPVSPQSPLNCGLIRAKFTLSAGPGKPQPVALQFCRDGGALPSGTTITLRSEGYRLTMCKYRLLGDRYFCDPPMAPLSLASSGGCEPKSPSG